MGVPLGVGLCAKGLHEVSHCLQFRERLLTNSMRAPCARLPGACPGPLVGWEENTVTPLRIRYCDRFGPGFDNGCYVA